jgi:glycosyltransferase involved in cell wall biosynthesis
MIRVLALPRYNSLGPSSRIRFFQYQSALASLGVELQFSYLLDDDYVRRLYNGRSQSVISMVKAYINRIACVVNSRHFDLLWIEKELLPWLPACLDRLFTTRRVPFVVDYDDAIYHRYDMHSNPLIRVLLGKKVDAVMHQAATVVVGNDYLAERARRAGAGKVEYLPSVVDTDRYTMMEKRGGQLRIGWIGSPITAPYLELIKDPLGEALQQFDARLVLVGAGEKDLLPGLDKEILPWSITTEVAHIQSCDLGIMPIPDGPFERGKCGYKLIQYMACGLPVVASPVGVNSQIVEQGKTGFLASSGTEWLEALVTLARDAHLRSNFGEAGRKKVEQGYTLQLTAPRLAEILKEAASR